MHNFSWSPSAIAVIPLFYVHCAHVPLQSSLATSALHSVSKVSEGNAPDQMQLLDIIAEPMPGEERYQELTPLWEVGSLSDEERAELLAIVEAREEVNARRVKAVLELAQLRDVPFTTLWRELMGAPPEPRVIAG